MPPSTVAISNWHQLENIWTWWMGKHWLLMRRPSHVHNNFNSNYELDQQWLFAPMTATVTWTSPLMEGFHCLAAYPKKPLSGNFELNRISAIITAIAILRFNQVIFNLSIFLRSVFTTSKEIHHNSVLISANTTTLERLDWNTHLPDMLRLEDFTISLYFLYLFCLIINLHSFSLLTNFCIFCQTLFLFTILPFGKHFVIEKNKTLEFWYSSSFNFLRIKISGLEQGKIFGAA